jgi:hypothetical protein
MAENDTSSKKLGRDEVLDAEELLDRLKGLKLFLEDNWGRVGDHLKRARKPGDIRSALKRVPNVEWCIPFRDHSATSLLGPARAEVNWRRVRRTRDRYKEAAEIVDRLWPEYHDVHRKADDADTAMKAYMAQFSSAKRSKRQLSAIRNVERELGVKELTDKKNQIRASVELAQKKKDRLKELLTRQEASFSQSELLRFTKNKRFEKSLLNFAKAMAGLPDYGWLHSFRRCSAILKSQHELLKSKRTNHQLFELVETIVKKAKTMNLEKIQTKLQKELLKKDTDVFLKGHVCPNWAYVEQSFAECRGKRYRRADIAFKIMDRILHNFERGKTITETELAKRKQLVYS